MSAPVPMTTLGRDGPASAPRLRGALGAALVAGAAAAAVLAPWIAPFDPELSDLEALMQPPSWTSGHLFGTDDLGRDVLSRVIHGGRAVIAVAGAATALSVVIGAVLGVTAGYRGGLVDHVVSRVADIQQTVPGLILALLALALFGSRPETLVVVLALEAWPLHFRVTRTWTAATRRLGYMEAAWLAGVSTPRILVRHVVPGIVPLITATAAISAAVVVMTAAGLSFIGLGIQPPTADWGLMIAQGKAQLGAAWWISVGPAAALVVLLVGIQMLGDALSEHFSGDGVRL